MKTRVKVEHKDGLRTIKVLHQQSFAETEAANLVRAKIPSARIMASGQKKFVAEDNPKGIVKYRRISEECYTSDAAWRSALGRL